MEEIIICFESVSQAIMAESELTDAGFNVRVMPVPESIKGGCGFCLRFFPEDFKKAAVILKKLSCNMERTYTRRENDGGVSYLPLLQTES